MCCGKRRSAKSANLSIRTGWHVLEVMERRQHDMSEDARRNLAIRALHNRR